MTSYVDTAKAIAHEAHAGQVDKAGRPYIEHPARVAAAVAHLGPEYEAAAWLHDVVEDSGWSIPAIYARMNAQGTPCPMDVAFAVDRLTKMDGEPYLRAVVRASAGVISCAVKLADNLDNSAEERLALLEPATAERLRQKYARAREALALGAWQGSL